MKALIKYSNWLMKTRGKIEPKVGDIVKLFSSSMSDHTVSKINYPHNDNSNLISLVFSEDCDWEYLGNCYVEIDLPEIEWREGPYREIDRIIFHSAFINSVPIFTISYRVRDSGCHLFNLYSNIKLFSGTLEECKLKAEELLFKL